MRKILTIAALLCGLLAPGRVEAAYANHKSYTVKASQITGTLTNFTVDLAFTDTDLKTTGNGGFVTDAQGDDVAYFSNSDCSTGPLKFARISWSATTGAFHHKVKIASAAAGSVIHQCFGDAGVTSDQSDAANTFDASTCASYSFGDGTTLSVADALGNMNGTNHSGTAVTGQVGGGIALNGTSAYVDLGATTDCVDQDGLTPPDEELTVNAIVKPTDAADYYFIAAATHTNIPSPFEWRLQVTTGHQYFGNGDNTDGHFESTTSVGTGSWAIIGTTYNADNGVDSGGRRTFYLSGAADGTNSAVTNGGTFGNFYGDSLFIGTRSDNYAYFNGSIDELRIDKTERSAAWEAAIFNNQTSMSSFWDVSVCTGCSGGSSPERKRSGTMGASR